MDKPTGEGKFVVLDGNDGSGKATQAGLLAERFRKDGVLSEKLDFPAYDTNFFGALIGECLRGEHGDFVHMDPKVVSPLYALDRLESTPHIRKSLEEGRVVISDRFSSSNQIHQGGKIEDKDARAEFLQWLDKMEHEVLGIPRPDAIIYLRVPVQISLELLSEKRKAKNSGLADGQKDTVEADRMYLEHSHEAADWLSRHQPNWHIIDCVENNVLRKADEIHEEVYAALAGILKG